MLTLLLVLYASVLVFAILKRKEYNICRIFLFVSIFLLPMLIIVWGAMFKVIYQNDTGNFQKKVSTLTEANKQIEDWIVIIEDRLSNEPELLEYIKKDLEEEINSNNEEISNSIDLQENNYRWWLYFK